MKARHTCGLVAFGFLFVLVACLIFAALAGAMVLRGEVPLYAPRLIGVQPWTNYAFQPTTPLTLTFDQPMDAASLAAAFSLDPPVPGTFRWNQTRTQVTFIPDSPGYEPGTAYTVRLVPGVKAGTLPRTTKQGAEWGFSLPPLVDASSPSLGQEDQGAWAQLQVSFNYPLDCDSTAQTFSITPDAIGRLECRDRTLTFNPTEPLEPGTAYVAQVGQVYLEGDRSARPGVRWEFHTAPPLAIVDVAPLTREAVIDLGAPVRITFNRPVVADSVLSRFSLAPEGGQPLAGQGTWEEDGAGFVFQPAEPLRPATSYRLVLQAGVQDELGFQVAESLDRSFKTAPMVDLPLPAPGSADVALDSTIRIPFTRPMDKTSVEAGLVFSPPLEGRVAWEEDTLVFTPRRGLAGQTNYKVTLNPGVRDASGAPLAEPARWEFATEPFLLEARVPPGVMTLMELRQPITFAFALPMDRQSVLAALILSPTVTGTLVWTDDARTVAFRPDPAWLSGTGYRVTLSGSARAADGSHALGEDQTWTFATGVTRVQFGYGPNVQVMDAQGERAFQLVAQGADVADFRLYAITSTQFLDLYSSGFRGIGPQESQIVDTAGLPLAAAWREVLAPWGDRAYSKDWRTAEAHLPADVPPGLYLLSAGPSLPQAGGAEESQGQLLVVLSRHTLVLKTSLAGTGSRSQAQVVAWDTGLSTGAPVVSATVRLYDRDGAFLDEGQTDASGLVTLDVPGDPGPLLALAERDGDVTVCGLGNEWSQTGWWEWWSQPASRPLYVTYAYTDRPIYRPGQAVYFKDFVRANDDVSYTLPPPDLPVTVRLRDARDNVAATQVLTPTQFGTVYGEFQLADEPVLGTWNLETEVEGTVSRQPLKVEEYRKPEYEVTVQTAQSLYVGGEAISVTVGAAYYFGQPVGGARLALAVYPTYPDSYYGLEMTPFGSTILSLGGRTDEQGRWTAVIPTDDLFPPGNTAQRAALALEATVTDDSGQSVSSYQTVAVLRTSQGLTLLLKQHGYRPDEEILFAAQVRDRDGEPVAGAELTAQVLGWDERKVASATATTDASGQAHFSVQLSEQSWYTLRVHGIDDSGRTMQAEEWLWVYDPAGQAPWYQGRWGKEAALSISADRTTYAVGDEARLVVYAPVPGPALLTFERGETRRAEPIALISGTNLITVPIRADYAPNIYVTVSQFGPLSSDWSTEQSRSEAGLHQASTQLLVPMADHLLTVTLTADQETYAPGDEATFHVRVADHQGRPVVAEVSLAVVDEAIYALTEDQSRDPFEVFYAPRPDLVRSFDSLRPTRWLFSVQGFGGGGGEAGGAPRRSFLDTAYWAPTVVADENGEATIAFRLPDNLTEWRALARAITADTRVGQATTSIVVDKDIVVRPSLPRFLTQGDAITLTAVVHNFTSQEVSATVTLDLEGLAQTGAQGTSQGEGAREQVVSVPVDGSAMVAWPVVAEEPGEAKVTVRATATYHGAHVVGHDAVELPLPVYPLAVADVATFAGTLTPARPTDTITLNLPSDAIAGLSRLEINLAPSIAPGLLDGLEYLIDYPFG